MRRPLDRLAGDAGFTLIEILLAMVLMLGIMAATLTTFADFTENNRRNQDQNDAQDKARMAIDRIARDLRNQATPTMDLGTDAMAIQKATARDVAFFSVDRTRPAGSLNVRNLKRVRYCLNTGTGVLWMQEKTWSGSAVPPAAAQGAPGAACPETPVSPGEGSAWTSMRPIADNVVNGTTRALFSFTPSAPASNSEITAVNASVFVDAEPNRKPNETRLSTAVTLRNQNRVPVNTDFASKPVGSRHVLLVGTGASDPDGNLLMYEWRVNGSLITSCTSVVCDYGPEDTPPATGGTHNFSLRVFDSSDLHATSPTKGVTIQP
jgi:prepilin-type N-terminal cleavage/methylation domain-containing protein